MKVEVIQGQAVESGKVLYCIDCGLRDKVHAVVLVSSRSKVWPLCDMCFSTLVSLSQKAMKELL